MKDVPEAAAPGAEALVEQARSLVADDRLSAAVALLLKQPRTRYLQTELTLLARRLTEAERDKASALITDEDFSVRRNGITASILRLVEGLASSDAGVRDLPEANVEALYRYGNLLLRHGDFRRASEYFDKALDEDPGHLSARLDRGVARCAQGLLSEAVEDLSTVLAHDRDQPFARFNRGVALWGLGRKAEACADWRFVKDLGFDLADDVLRQRCGTQDGCVASRA